MRRMPPVLWLFHVRQFLAVRTQQQQHHRCCHVVNSIEYAESCDLRLLILRFLTVRQFSHSQHPGTTTIWKESVPEIIPDDTHTHPFNGPLSGTTRVSRYQKGKTNLDFTEARDSEWQWHRLGHMQVCTSLQTDNHTSTPPLCFYKPDALPAVQPTVSKH